MEIKVSIGEIIDKLTILVIKKEKIQDESKLKNIKFEYEYLASIVVKIPFKTTSKDYKDLYHVNLTLWDIEEGLRDKEQKKEFDEEFINFARNECVFNDKRAEIKKRINVQFESEIVEEKSYEHL